MYEEYIGPALKKLRTDKQLTETFVTEGIMSTHYYRKVEQGIQIPTIGKMLEVLNRMRANYDDFYCVLRCLDGGKKKRSCPDLHANHRDHLFYAKKYYDYELTLFEEIIDESTGVYLQQTVPIIICGLSEKCMTSPQIVKTLTVLIHCTYRLLDLGELTIAKGIINSINIGNGRLSQILPTNLFLQYRLVKSLLSSGEGPGPKEIIKISRVLEGNIEFEKIASNWG